MNIVYLHKEKTIKEKEELVIDLKIIEECVNYALRNGYTNLMSVLCTQDQLEYEVEECLRNIRERLCL